MVKPSELVHTLGTADAVRRAFSLIELIVVGSTVVFLMAIVLTAVQSVREAARRVNCQAQLQDLALAVLNFESSHGRFPTGFQPEPPWYGSSWLVGVLPFAEKNSVWEQAELDYRIFPHDFTYHTGFRTLVPSFQCPSDPASGIQQLTHGRLIITTTSYLGVNGTNHDARDGVLFDKSRVRSADVIDGLSYTVMVGERPPSADFWYGWWYAGWGQSGDGSVDMLLGVHELKAPSAPFLEGCESGPYRFTRGAGGMCDALHYWSYHPGGANFARCDGSVQLLSYHTADGVLPMLATIASREVAVD